MSEQTPAKLEPWSQSKEWVNRVPDGYRPTFLMQGWLQADSLGNGDPTVLIVPIESSSTEILDFMRSQPKAA